MTTVSASPSQPAQVCDAKRLVALARSGDERALDEMTRCFGQRLVEVGRSTCGNVTDADDAVQDALLAAGQNLEGFRGEGSLEGWLVRLVVNACRRMHRGRKNDPRLHTTEADLVAEEDPEAAAARAEMMALLGKALLELKPQDRVIVLLAEAEEWTGPEIAEALGMTPVAVRSRLMRARQKLRNQLQRA